MIPPTVLLTAGNSCEKCLVNIISTELRTECYLLTPCLEKLGFLLHWFLQPLLCPRQELGLLIVFQVPCTILGLCLWSPVRLVLSLFLFTVGERDVLWLELALRLDSLP